MINLIDLPYDITGEFADYIDSTDRVLYEDSVEERNSVICPICEEMLDIHNAFVADKDTHEIVACIDCVQIVSLENLWATYLASLKPSGI